MVVVETRAGLVKGPGHKKCAISARFSCLRVLEKKGRVGMLQVR